MNTEVAAVENVRDRRAREINFAAGDAFDLPRI
jgi:hypothetical protein